MASGCMDSLEHDIESDVADVTEVALADVGMLDQGVLSRIIYAPEEAEAPVAAFNSSI